MPFEVDFASLKTKEHVLQALAIDEELFDHIVSFEPNQNTRCQNSTGDDIIHMQGPFLRHEIPKRNIARGTRTVWDALSFSNHYKALSRQLTTFFAARLISYPHSRCFGYVGGKNIRENAQDHCGHTHLLTVDIENFFPSIGIEKIVALLIRLGCELEVAQLLGKFVTIGGGLPLGLATSPTIANAICLELDVQLEQLALAHGSTFSRYADDISFSTSGELPSLNDICAIIEAHDFKVAESKTRRSKVGQAHFVTGLSVSDPNGPHVPKGKKRRLKKELYYAKKFGLLDHLNHLGISDAQHIQHEINRMDGAVKFTAYHEPKLAGQLKSDWNAILKASGERPSFSPRNQAGPPFTILVDEAEFVGPAGEPILALGMAVTQHPDRIFEATKAMAEDYLGNPYSTGNKQAISKRGLHFNDAHPDLRGAYVGRLRLLAFEGYAAYAALTSAENYEQTYLKLLKAMIKRRLMAAEGKHAALIVEKNSKVSQERIKEVVGDSFEELRNANNRRPEHFSVHFFGKPNAGLSAPDFLLGILDQFLKLGSKDRPDNPGKPPRDRLLFEQLRDKYRLILDADSGMEYSRRNPIEPWGGKG